MPDEAPIRVERRHIWYQVHYSRAAQDANDGLRGRRREQLRAANDRAIEVALVAATTLLHYGETEPGRTRPHLRWPFGRRARRRDRLTRFLIETVEPSVLILLAGVNEFAGKQKLRDRRELAGVLGGGKIEDYDVIEYVRRNDNLSYRAAYNLACYFGGRVTTNAAYAADALDELGEALRKAPRDEQADLARWAKQDPSLTDLRETRGDAVRAIVDYFAPEDLPHGDASEGGSRPRKERRKPLAEE